MVHKPRRSSVFGNRDLDGDERQASRKAVANQNLSPGRYDVKEEVKQATQKSIAKASDKRATTPVTINPVAPTGSMNSQYN